MATKLLFSVLIASGCVGAAETKQSILQDFASADTCKPCHTEIYQQWRTSFHSQAATDSLYWRLFQQSVREVGSRASALCLSCHVPVATVGREVKWFGPVSSELELSPVAREGVTCDFCHTISGNENLGRNISVGAYRLPHKGDTVIKEPCPCDAALGLPAEFQALRHLPRIHSFAPRAGNPEYLCGMVLRPLPRPGTGVPALSYACIHRQGH